jgi:copper chaperone CopZ
MIERTYYVSGMVCEHCAGFVTDELQLVDGVAEVAVDVDAGSVTLTSARALDVAEVRAAVEEAGYELADAR